jgi:hypothetical protein
MEIFAPRGRSENFAEFDTASVQSRSSDAPADRPHSEQGPEHRAAIVAWNHAEALHSPLRHAAIVPLPVGRHPGRQLLVSRKVVAAIGRAAAKPVIRWGTSINILLK